MDLALVWSCPVCTFENKEIFFNCEVCFEPRPFTARLAPPQQIATPAVTATVAVTTTAVTGPQSSSSNSSTFSHMPLSSSSSPPPPSASISSCSYPSSSSSSPAEMPAVRIFTSHNSSNPYDALPFEASVTEEASSGYCAEASCFNTMPCPVHMTEQARLEATKARERACRERQAQRITEEAERAKQQRARENAERAQEARERAEQQRLQRLEKQQQHQLQQHQLQQQQQQQQQQHANAAHSSPPRAVGSSSSSSSPSTPVKSDKPVNAEWKCIYCTLDNPISSIVCAACEGVCTDPAVLTLARSRVLQTRTNQDNCNCEACTLRRERGIPPTNPLLQLFQPMVVDRLDDMLRAVNSPPQPTRTAATATAAAAAASADKDWRASLSPGDYLDAFHEPLGHYYVAFVESVENDNLLLRFVEVEGDITVNRYSAKIAPAQSKSEDVEERDCAQGEVVPPLGAGVVDPMENVTALLVQLPDGRNMLVPGSLANMMGMTRRMEEEVVADLDPATLTKEDKAWRESLKVGDLLDALDTVNQWYIAEVIEEEKGGGKVKITFTEWQSRWDTWVSRWSPRIAEPKTKSKTRAEQDLETIRLRSSLPDYSHIDIAHTPNCITKKPVPGPIEKGRMILSKMPGDNSCLFHAIGFVCGGQISPFVGGEEMMRNRLRCAKAVEKDPAKYTYEVLGCTNLRYCDRLKTVQEWGGAIELQILSDFFEVEIISFDAVGTANGPMVYKFPASDHKYEKRVFLVYRRDHYDALVFLHKRRQPQLQEFFAVSDIQAFKLARRHVELMHLALHRKGHGSMTWKGLNEEEQTPIITRSASQTLDDDDCAPRSAPRMNRTRSEK